MQRLPFSFVVRRLLTRIRRSHSPPPIERGGKRKRETREEECVGTTQRDRALGPKPNEIVNSGTGRQPSGAALPCEGELSRLRSGGTPASLLSSRHLSCRSIRRLAQGLLDELSQDELRELRGLTYWRYRQGGRISVLWDKKGRGEKEAPPVRE